MNSHSRAGVFRRHYMRQTVKTDTQSVYLETVNWSDLVKKIGLISISRDPRASVELGAEDLNHVKPSRRRNGSSGRM